MAGDVTQNNGSLKLDGSAINGTLALNGGATEFKNAGSSVQSLTGQQGAQLNTALTLTHAAGRYDGALSGSGRLTVQNGKEILTGNNTYSGPTTIEKGANLQLGNGGNTGSIGNASSITNNGTLAVDRNDTLVMGQSLTGDGRFEQNGLGTTVLGNATNYNGTIAVNAGHLEVNGQQDHVVGQTTVASGAALAGTGTLGGSVNVASQGVLNPGTNSDPTGRLTVKGDLTMNQGSVLQTSAIAQNSGQTIKNDAGVSYNVQQSSSVNVQGNTNFDHTSFQLHVTGDKHMQYGQAYVLASSNGPINFSGNMDQAGRETAEAAGIVDTSSFASPVLRTMGDPVLALVLERNNVSFATAGTTKNTRTAGLGLDSLPTSNALSQTFTAMSSKEAGRYLHTVSGEVHASVRTALIQDSFYVRQAALDRLDSADCDGSASNGISTASLKTGRKTSACLANEPVLWGRALGSLGHNSGDGNAASMHHSTAGFVIGLDAPVFNQWRVGGLVSYSHSMFNIGSGLSSSGRSDNISIGGYAGRHWGNLHLRLGASYTWNIMGMNRSVVAGNYSDRLSSGYMGGTAQGFGELAYKFHTKHAVFEPFANVAYVNQHTDGYREHGGAAALAGKSMNTGVTFATFGARASTSFMLGRTLLTTHGSLAYRHTFGLTSSSVRQGFASTHRRNTMDVGGVPLSLDAAVVNFGVGAKLTDRINVDLSYIGQYGNHSVDSGAQASVSAAF